MCRVQVKDKNERQNDDYATANANPNSSSHHDEAHHIRRRLSQTITSRSCLLIAIALALPSAHACDDTVELQVTCDSRETTWVVTSSDTIDDDTTVTVGSCIDGRVKDVAQVKEKDIGDNGIVLCSQPTVCYHLKWISGDQIGVKNCGNDSDPICNYICYDNSFTRKREANLDGTAREPINDNIICDNSTNNAYIYECNGNIIVRKTHCHNGCADDNKGCKQNPDLSSTCTANDTLICKDGALFDCRNSKYIEGGKSCNDKGEVVFCKGNSVASEKNICADGKVAWCKPNEPTPLQMTDCLPSSPKDKLIACNDLNNSRRSCDENGNILPEESCSDGQTKCADDLKGRVGCNGRIIDACQYCYNESIENNFTSIEELGCDGCVPNEYNFGDSSESIFNAMNSICHNGKEFEFKKIENRNFLFIPPSSKNGLWDFALNVTPALSKDQLVVPANEQSKQTWRYYNCHNDDAMEFLKGFAASDDADKFVKTLNELKDTIGGNVIDSIVPKTCCDENSYYITQTGYRYYSVEKCTNIALYDTNKNASIPTNFSAYAYTTELNDFLIGVEDDFLAKDYACLEAKDSSDEGDEAVVRHMMFIKQQTDGDQESQDGEPKHGIYEAFECPEKYECDLKNPYNGLCIFHEIKDIAGKINECNNVFACNKDTNTISCGQTYFAACPEGTKLRIVGDNSKCEGKSNLKLDQIQCVPDGKFTPEQ